MNSELLELWFRSGGCEAGRCRTHTRDAWRFEAYPEGNQRHLSAESALYCRVYTEGMFGIRPTGFNSFLTTPRLPDGWDGMKLKSIHAFENVFDLSVLRAGEKLRVEISKGGKTVQSHQIKMGETLSVDLRKEQ